MEATKQELNQPIESPVSQESTTATPTQFDSMTPEQLKDYALNLSSKLHSVNEESKSRKIKLRELEAEKLQREETLLREQGKFEELYKTAQSELEQLRPLRTFKEEHDRLQIERLANLEKQLTATEREELGIFDDLTTDKKLRWIELKLKNRSSINLDNSSSVKAGGGLKQLPQNRTELGRLSNDELLAFKKNNPLQYSIAMKTT